MSKKSRGFDGIGNRTLMLRIGKNIRLARKARKLTIAELASLAGVGTSTLSRLESGDEGISLGVLLSVLAIMRLDNTKTLRIAEQDDDPVFVEPLQKSERAKLEKLLEFDDD